MCTPRGDGAYDRITAVAMRHLWMVLAVVACRAAPLDRVESTWNVVPESLTFAATPVGVTSGAALEVHNESRAPVLLSLQSAGPFDFPRALRVEGGNTARIAVTFTPDREGAFDAQLAVRESEGHQQMIAIAGSGRVLTCADGDDVSCADPCLVQLHCVSERCVGEARDCSDGDACTIDAC